MTPIAPFRRRRTGQLPQVERPRRRAGREGRRATPPGRPLAAVRRLPVRIRHDHPDARPDRVRPMAAAEIPRRRCRDRRTRPGHVLVSPARVMLGRQATRWTHPTIAALRPPAGAAGPRQRPLYARHRPVRLPGRRGPTAETPHRPLTTRRLGTIAPHNRLDRRTGTAWRVRDCLTARRACGGTLLLGLEVLVAADLLRTIAVAPTLDNVLVLGLIVAIRTFLSFSLETEIEGIAPWRRALIGGAGTIRRASASALESETPP